MAATHFNTENRTYRQLLGNGLTYRIPRFQRDYSWNDEHWEDLWADIQGILPEDGEPAHYMGYLVLQTADNRSYDVIDGQQRLTTMSLVVLAAMRLLGKLADEGRASAENRKRVEQLRATYIGYLDPVILTTRNKLSLNCNNDGYYRDYLVALAEHLPQRGFPASTQAMRRAFEWFERRLREQVKTAADAGMALAQFVETMSDKLFFTVITVADQLNAYKVFETLNARGVRLSATDLLKNYLFSVLARGHEATHEMDELERRWEAMVGRLGGESFPDFLRMHWNSRHSFARQTELFKVVRGHIQTREAVFALLREMDEDIDTYLALTQPERKLTADLDQALVLIGACFDGSGINATDTLKNDNFKPHAALKALLEWLSKRGATLQIRQAASRALSIYNTWAASHQQQVQQLQLFFGEEWE